MNLFTELRRRNVLRMAVLYVLAAWVVMQVAGVLMDLGALPVAAGPWVLVALVIGFPIALVFSWLFEITPEGLAREKDVPEDASITHITGRRMDFIVIAVLSAGLILFAGDKWWPRGPVDLSIAVLPLKNMSPDPEQEYFADGLSEEILNLLAHIRPLKVTARTSSFSFKHKEVDIPTIAAQLNTRYILEGSVRTHQDRVRITAQLIDSKDGTHVWSQTYDRDLSAEDLFFIQSDVARAITDRLRVTLTAADEERLSKVPTENNEAYAAYLLGRHWLADRKIDELGKAAGQFAKAIELDPNFAAAFSGLFDACYLYIVYSGGHVHEECPDPDPTNNPDYADVIAPFARKAVELDENLGEAWISLAATLDLASETETSRPKKLAKLREAHAAYERGLSLNPSQAQAYSWYALSLGSPDHYGSFEEWRKARNADTWHSVLERGLAVDPLSITLHSTLSNYPMSARTKEEALFHARRIVEIAPESPLGYVRLGDLTWWHLGRIDESIRWTNKAAEIDPQNPRYAMRIAHGYATLGDMEKAMAYWERSKGLFADDHLPEKMYTLHALILLSGKDGIPMQQVLDALEPVRIGSTNRMEIEASLAIIRGEAKDWLATNRQFLSECLEVDIDVAFLDDKSRDCGIWLDGVLKSAGNEALVQKVAAKQMNWLAKLWREWETDLPDWHIGFAKYHALLGQNDKALVQFEQLIRKGYRGNPFTARLYLDEDLRFMLYHDPVLAPIRDHPRFQAVVAEVEADLAQQLANVREMERKGELPTLAQVCAELDVHSQGACAE